MRIQTCRQKLLRASLQKRLFQRQYLLLFYLSKVFHKKRNTRNLVFLFFGGEPAKMVEPELKEKECFARFICFSSCKI